MAKRTAQRSMLHETAVLSIFSVALQTLGLLLNIFLTRQLGAASVGALTLMGSFYGLAAVLSGGSGFISTSRFLSEELGCAGDPSRVFRHAICFCMSLSSVCAAGLMLTAPLWITRIAETGATLTAVRLLSLTLPVAALSACLKGRCYAFHRVYVPAVGECIEFLLRACVMAFCAVFLIPRGKLTIMTAFACSMLAGQCGSALFLLAVRVPYGCAEKPCSLTFRQFIRMSLPIIGNACLVSLLSSANDALVPLTLLQYGNSTEEALSQFGEFEAIIIPTLFFPSVIQCCMSGLLVPELARSRAAEDSEGICKMTQRVLEQTVAYSLFVILILMQFGVQIGTLLGGDRFVGEILRVMAPVVPLIYLEIILEGVLRGMGQQNFSSLNYLAEYTVRISVLLICVPLFGFYGIVASYLACNVTGNAVRIFFVLRATGLHPRWGRILLRPAFTLVLSWQLTALLMLLIRMMHLPDIVLMLLFTGISGGLYLFLLRVVDQIRPYEQKNGAIPQKSAAILRKTVDNPGGI